MLDQDLVDMLDSDDADDRLFAVKAMAKSRDPEYLQYLAIVYRTDDDPDVKDMALKAGKYIKKAAAEDDWTGGEAVYDDDDEDEEVEVSQRDQERAQSYVEQASNLSFSDENEKAIEMLRKALLTNPNLKNDDYTRSLSSTITGYSDDMAISYILSEASQPKAKNKRGGGADETTWEEAIVDLAIYWLVNAGVTIVSVLLFSRAITDLATQSEFLTPAELEGLGALASGGLVAVLISGFFISLFQVFALLIYYSAIHMSATMLFAGDGTFKGLIHKTSNYLIVVVVIFSITGFIQQYVIITSSFGLEPNSLLTTLAALSSGISFFGGIGAMFWFGSLIGQNYDFGMGKGCAAVVAGVIGLALLSCACVFIFTSILGVGLSGIDAMMSSFIPLVAY